MHEILIITSLRSSFYCYNELIYKSQFQLNISVYRISLHRPKQRHLLFEALICYITTVRKNLSRYLIIIYLSKTEAILNNLKANIM